jgi:ubiquinone/menaquinone biosynthesis C-methylase UbiE
MKINIGGGYKRYDGFVNVDHDPLTNPEYVADLEKDPLPFEDSSVDEVKAHHILEHIGPGYFHLMKQLYRVCKNGAIVDIVVPHHRHEIWFGDPTHIRFITVEQMRLFSKKYNEYHIKQFNSSSGFGLKLDVDFEIVEYDFKPDEVWAPRLAQMTPEQIDEVSRNFNNVYGETMIKLVVVKDE